MSTEQEHLHLVLAAQNKRDNLPDIADRVVAELQSSLIFQNNWEELLVAAPVAISSIGALYMASSSPVARSIQLPPGPSGSFKYLSYTALRANLVECGDIGRSAFIEAEAGMGKIKHVSKLIYNKVPDIVDSLADPPTARKLLPTQMKVLKDAADTAYKTAAAIDEKFNTWLLYVCEFNAACEQKSTTTQDTLHSNEITMVAEKTRLNETEKAVVQATQVTETLGKQLNLASDAYKKASEEYPTGWDILGQQIVGDLANCVTTALNQAIPALVDNLNPIAKAKAGMNMFSNVIHGEKNNNIPAEDNHNNNNNTKKAPQEPIRVDTRPTDSDDPAYTQVSRDLVYLTTLNVMLTGGEDGGVNWNSLAGTGLRTSTGGDADSREKAAKSSIGFILSMIQDAKKTFQALATPKDPSKRYLAILQTAETVAQELSAEVAKSSDISARWPEKDSALVKGWQDNFTLKYGEAVQMGALARSLPGNTTGGVPLMSDTAPIDPAVQVAQINAKSTQAQAVLDHAQKRLNTTQTAFLKTQEVYAKSTELMIQQQNKLADIKADLEKLTKSHVSLEEIKEILFECIKLIVTLKEQIQNLVRFFKALSTTLEVVVQYSVQPFLDEITASVAPSHGDNPKAVMKIGSFTFTDFQRSTIFQSTLTIRAYFGVFGDIADMWILLSKNHIFPGISLAEQVGLARSDESMGAKAKKLQTWSATAQAAIKDMVEKKRREILAEMEGRVNEVAEVTKYLPPPPPGIQKAIEAGANEVKTSAETAIQENAAAKPVNRFSMKKH